MGAGTFTFPEGKDGAGAGADVGLRGGVDGGRDAGGQGDGNCNRIGYKWKLLRVHRHGGSAAVLHAALCGEVRPAGDGDGGVEGWDGDSRGRRRPEVSRGKTGGTGFGEKGISGGGAWVGRVVGVWAQGGAVRVRVGISYVSEANARGESGGGECCRRDVRGRWRRGRGRHGTSGWDRSRLKVGRTEQRIVFATALYHALQTPTTYSDANGEYHGDGQGRRTTVVAGQAVQYANFSGWDVYRSQLQLLTWLDAKQGSDVAQSLLNQSREDGGRWDRWTHMGGATHVMNGDPAAAAIADIWAFGGRGFETKAALASLVHAAEVPTKEDLSHDGCPVECVGQRPGLDQWLTLHYIPVGAPAWGPAADTLEDVSAEFGISALAGHLGDEAVRARFAERAQYWKNIWNPKAAPDGGYFMNRNADGSWPMLDKDDDDDNDQTPKPFTPATGAGFVEGSAAQYVWMVPFNVQGLFEQMGGREKAVARLDRFFYDEKGAPAVTKAGPLHAELDNEPSIETPWLYNFAGQPWKTQQLVRQVLDILWVNKPNGIPGNDDLGEMSSWAVFASMGLYPEIPGRAELVLASPLFTKVTVHRAAGDVRITAPAAGSNAIYVHEVKVDGKASSKTWLPESFALTGGRLEFDLVTAPDKGWGVGKGDEPPSFGSK